MYYKLTCDLSFKAGYIVQKRNQNVRLISGTLIDIGKFAVLPSPYTIKPNPEEGLAMSDLYTGKCLMSNRLAETLKDAGVDSLQTFPAEITNTVTGEVYKEHCVYNVIGLVSCAQQDASESKRLAGSQFFTKLSIDESNAQDLKMFRLAESKIDILVHESIAKVIENKNFIDVVLEPVESA